MAPDLRKETRRALAGALLLAAATALAQPVVDNPAGRPRTIEEANAQRDRAAAMKQAAEDRLDAEQAECYRKFLASSCLRDAKARYSKAVIEARNIDIPARDFQRDYKRAEVETKESRREAENETRGTEQQAQASEFRSKEATRAAERERKIAEKAEQAAKYREKAAAEEAARRERQAQRERRDAERAAKKAAGTADSAAKLAP